MQLWPPLARSSPDAEVGYLSRADRRIRLPSSDTLLPGASTSLRLGPSVHLGSENTAPIQDLLGDSE